MMSVKINDNNDFKGKLVYNLRVCTMLTIFMLCLVFSQMLIYQLFGLISTLSGRFL